MPRGEHRSQHTPPENPLKESHKHSLRWFTTISSHIGPPGAATNLPKGRLSLSPPDFEFCLTGQ